MDEKVAISLISTATGWLLAQGTAFVKDRWSARKLKNGLLTELGDVQGQLQRVVGIYARKLQIASLQGIEPTSALPVQNMFFKQYYKEAFSHLNREQRLSYQLIHAALDNLNKKNDDLAKFFEESHKDLRDASDEEKVSNIRAEWEERVILLYKTTNEVLWHIVYHLRYPDAPTLDHMGPIHESYLKFEQELDIEVKTIIEKAKTLKRDDFEKYYDEGTFARHQAAR